MFLIGYRYVPVWMPSVISSVPFVRSVTSSVAGMLALFVVRRILVVKRTMSEKEGNL